MDLIDLLKRKKIKVTEIPKWGAYLRKQWENNFANSLSVSEKKSIYFDSYLWHLFSYEKKSCLRDNRANTALHEEVKKECYLFYQHSECALILENAASLTAADLFNEGDVYITDKKFTWTYVNTHESYLGPYFSRKNNE